MNLPLFDSYRRFHHKCEGNCQDVYKVSRGGRDVGEAGKSNYAFTHTHRHTHTQHVQSDKLDSLSLSFNVMYFSKSPNEKTLLLPVTKMMEESLVRTKNLHLYIFMLQIQTAIHSSSELKSYLKQQLQPPQPERAVRSLSLCQLLQIWQKKGF